MKIRVKKALFKMEVGTILESNAEGFFYFPMFLTTYDFQKVLGTSLLAFHSDYFEEIN